MDNAFKAREIAPALPKPTFSFKMPEFFRKSAGAAEVKPDTRAKQTIKAWMSGRMIVVTFM